MFIHDTGKLCVMAATRCGHTSMAKHFNIPAYTPVKGNTSRYWNTTSSHAIVVLRHPIERMYSAYHASALMDVTDKDGYLVAHSWPYLHLLMRDTFSWIDFKDLSLYIEMDRNTTVTYTTNTTGSYIPNSGYTELQLKREIGAYTRIVNNKPKLTVNEWKELCS